MLLTGGVFFCYFLKKTKHSGRPSVGVWNPNRSGFKVLHPQKQSGLAVKMGYVGGDCCLLLQTSVNKAEGETSLKQHAHGSTK